MRRRGLVAALGGALLLPACLPLFAQPTDRPRRVLVLFQVERVRDSWRKEIAEVLRARGWIEGRNLLLEVRHARPDGQDLPAFAAESVRAAPDVIMLTASPLATAIRNTGTTIPCVVVAVWDPIALGLARSLARPGGTYTGNSAAVPEGFLGKQVELLRKAVPGLKRIALLVNPRHPLYLRDRAKNLKVVGDQGLETIEAHAATREELEPAFREAVRHGATGMIVFADPLTVAQRGPIAELAMRHQLPTMSLFDANVEAGGLMSYGTDLLDLQRRGAEYVARILHGAKPGELPIEQPTKFELVINLKTAKALGLTLPQSLLLRADRVIE